MRLQWIGMTGGIILIALSVLQYTSQPSEADKLITPTYVAAEGKVATIPGYDIDVGTGELNGRIAKIMVKEGGHVQKGQIVAQLDNDDLKAEVLRGERELAVARSKLVELESGARKEQILEATASLEGTHARMIEAQSQLRRYRTLRKKHLIPQATLDDQIAAYKAARSAVDEAMQRKKLLEAGPKPETVQLYKDQVQLAQATLDYDRNRLERTIIRSPIAGTVIKQYLDEGEGVTPETPIVAVADLRKVCINAEVEETDVGKIKPGDIAEVTSNAYPGRTFMGSVKQIADYAGERKYTPSNPAVNLGLKVVQVKVMLKRPSPLRLGMSVNIKIPIRP